MNNQNFPDDDSRQLPRPDLHRQRGDGQLWDSVRRELLRDLKLLSFQNRRSAVESLCRVGHQIQEGCLGIGQK